MTSIKWMEIFMWGSLLASGLLGFVRWLQPAAVSAGAVISIMAVFAVCGVVVLRHE